MTIPRNPFPSAMIRSLLAIATLALASTAYPAVSGAAAAPEAGSAREAAEAKILGSGVGTKLEQTLGGTFSGVWFDRSRLKLHVGVTSASDRQLADETATASGVADLVVPTMVRFNWKQLEQAQQDWNARLRRLFPTGGATTALLPETNSVQILVSSALPPAQISALHLAAEAAAVPVFIKVQPASQFVAKPAAKCAAFVELTANCEPSITAGVGIDNNAKGECTAGPLLIREDRSTSQKATETFVLTAGHCFHRTGVGETWSAFGTEKEKEVLGTAIEELMPNALVPQIDAGVIKVESVFWAPPVDPPVEPYRANWKAGEETEPVLVTNGEEPVIHTEICIAGRRSGVQCGEVTALNQPVKIEYTEPELWETEALAQVAFKNPVGAGDSGAPVFAAGAAGTILGHFVAYVPEGGKKEGKTGWFEPLGVTLGRLETKYELLTKTNRTRHKGGFKSEKEHAVLTVSSNAMQKLAFTAGGTSIECTTLSIDSATVKSETTSNETIEFIPTYTNCEKILGLSVSVASNECRYVLHLEASKTSGTIDFSCPTGKTFVIEVGAGFCQYTVGNQKGLSTVNYKNTGSGTTREVVVEPSVTGISSTRTKNGFGCPTAGTTGTLSGKSTFTGETSEGSHEGFYIG